MTNGHDRSLRGSMPAPGHGKWTFLVVGFVLLAALDHVFFSRKRGLMEPTLDQRLAMPVQPPRPGAIEGFRRQSRPSVPLRSVEATLKRGDTVSSVLSNLGASRKSSGAALAALSRFVDMRRIKPGQSVEVDLRPNGTIVSLKFPLDRVRFVHVEPAKDGKGYMAALDTVPTEKELVQVACMVRGSLFKSMDRCGTDKELARIAVSLLRDQVDFFSDTRRGDVIRMIIVRESLDGRFLKYGRVRGLLYEGRIVTASAFPLDTDEGVEYFDQDGVSVKRKFLRSPLSYTRVSSRFALRRLHPILQTYTPHRALDYAAPRGTPVHAVGDGTVIFRGWKGASGRLVVLKHAGGLQTYYAHLYRIAKGLKVGDKVRKGQYIGQVGSSGRADGPHLHFAVARDGAFVNPRVLLLEPAKKVPEDRRMEFMAYVGRVVGELKALSVRDVDGSGR